MAQKGSAPAKAGELVIERVFDAPRELVWKAWTDPEAMMQWWGPRGYTTPHCEIDARTGGTFFLCMRSPEGNDIWVKGEYREVVEPERIVCTDCFADEHGNIVPASHYGMEGDFPLEMLITVMLEDMGGKTKMTLRHEGLPAGEQRDGANVGWNESFDRLDELLAAA